METFCLPPIGVCEDARGGALRVGMFESSGGRHEVAGVNSIVTYSES